MADYSTVRSGIGARAAEIDAGLRAHMSKVYGTMSTGMLITALAAWAIAGLAVTADPSAAYNTGEGIAAIRDGQYLTGLGYAIFASPLRWVIMLAPLAVLFLGMGPVMRNASPAGARLFFYGFATLIGLSLSSVFLVYTAMSITQTFLVTAIAFAGLSLYGYTTKKDLSGWGTFLMMGLIGLIVAMVMNLILGAFFGIASPALSFAISAIGVLIFAGLTAYDTQTIKSEYVAHAHHGDAEWVEKSGIFGALSLYLNFLNMFQFLLYFMGQSE